MSRLLLDTHAFLWWISDDPRLSPAAREAIADGASEVYLSAVSVWEMVIKMGLGRLELPEDLESFLARQLQANGFRPLAMTLPHALAVRHLPDVHKDPFDRLLVAQARHEELVLISGDEAVQRYPVSVIW
ncbi:type II toxin-antitoxin system VapC family toxin [Oceanithermus desulfurans]|uniref:Twitching motility protein PilT n=2 Tax=Oceanithermus desulfurans TaxID=227924 RepID=A0A511RP87_9DEIN|nr:type II toxin-antitoxin system VapC family toxin [Oceanithermus desulfurans]MBB6030829.1 PIN domain nuclease of toxin-antitoxin system [Oceanithermus desulfurans]GEM90596.1 twitching motility protein PilT [Oceanithermus desulfurans NBRC 100063]